MLRSTPKSHSDADIAAAIAYGKRVKLYPLSAAANPPETVFTDVKDVIYDSTIRFDVSFFRSLDRVVQSEPWIERDRVMIDQLRTIGLEKGKAFAPDSATQNMLTAAAGEARVLLDQRYEPAGRRSSRYDRLTHALVRNMPRASRASNAADVQRNSDGSIDVYFGPKAPAGKETNWVPTDPQRGFELLFRIYGPKKEFFDKAWVLPDVEKAAPQ